MKLRKVKGMPCKHHSNNEFCIRYMDIKGRFKGCIQYQKKRKKERSKDPKVKKQWAEYERIRKSKWTLEEKEDFYKKRNEKLKNNPKSLENNKRLARKRRGQINAPTRPMPNNCECCGKSKESRDLYEDHNHETGLFRGWVCLPCNAHAIWTCEQSKLLENTLKYLELYNGPSPKSRPNQAL